jgi:hypothetical protein
MLELSVTPALPRFHPTIRLDPLDQFLDLHFNLSIGLLYAA